jgi:hypothetical protein
VQGPTLAARVHVCADLADASGAPPGSIKNEAQWLQYRFSQGGSTTVRRVHGWRVAHDSLPWIGGGPNVRPTDVVTSAGNSTVCTDCAAYACTDTTRAHSKGSGIPCTLHAVRSAAHVSEDVTLYRRLNVSFTWKIAIQPALKFITFPFDHQTFRVRFQIGDDDVDLFSCNGLNSGTPSVATPHSTAPTLPVFRPSLVKLSPSVCAWRTDTRSYIADLLRAGRLQELLPTTNEVRQLCCSHASRRRWTDRVRAVRDVHSISSTPRVTTRLCTSSTPPTRLMASFMARATVYASRHRLSYVVGASRGRLTCETRQSPKLLTR